MRQCSKFNHFELIEYKNVHGSRYLTILVIGWLFIPPFDNQLERTKYICVLILDFEYCLWRWLWNVTYYVCVWNVYKMFGLSHFNKNKCMILLSLLCFCKMALYVWCTFEKFYLLFYKKNYFTKRFYPLCSKLYLYIFLQLSSK